MPKSTSEKIQKISLRTTCFLMCVIPALLLLILSHPAQAGSKNYQYNSYGDFEKALTSASTTEQKNKPINKPLPTHRVVTVKQLKYSPPPYFIGITASYLLTETLSKTSPDGGIYKGFTPVHSDGDVISAGPMKKKWGFGGFIGRDFWLGDEGDAGKLALYGSYEHFSNDTAISIYRNSQPNPDNDGAATTIRDSHIFLLNLDYYPPLRLLAGKLKPFIGLGAGLANNHMDAVYETHVKTNQAWNVRHLNGGARNNFAIEGRAGIALEIIKNVELGLAYQYTYVGNYQSGTTFYAPDTTPPSVQPGYIPYQVRNVGFQAVKMSLSYHFG